MAKKEKHLEMIQTVINRMANNLLFLRGWTITLVTVIFLLGGRNTIDDIYLLSAVPVIVMFWILDGYYMSRERLFRSLYDKVREQEETDVDFSMDTSPYSAIRRNGWPIATFGVTQLLFYGILLTLFIVLYFTAR